MNQEDDKLKFKIEVEDAQLNPQEAVALLNASKLRAQRQFDLWPPYLVLIGAMIFLFAYGVVWWSVRNQSPYVGPSGGALAVMYGGIAAWIVAVSLVIKRATKGISGQVMVKRRNYRAGNLVILFIYSLFQGALYHAGASHSIVYGIYPATAPWLFAGIAFVTLGVTREESQELILGFVLSAIGIGGAFAGPIMAWFVSGIGICIVMVGFAIVQTVKRRG